MEFIIFVVYAVFMTNTGVFILVLLFRTLFAVYLSVLLFEAALIHELVE